MLCLISEILLVKILSKLTSLFHVNVIISISYYTLFNSSMSIIHTFCATVCKVEIVICLLSVLAKDVLTCYSRKSLCKY